MTHTTDQERAEFEKWWSSPHIWGRGHKEAQWASWQAARRAPAAPVPQGWKLVPSESTEEMARAFRADDAPHYFVMTTMRCNDFAERYRAAISAAPQPPDAFQTEGGLKSEIRTTSTAPVQMPEPAGCVVYANGESHHWDANRECAELFASSERSRGAPYAFTFENLYTEQQVRQLLADNGIGKDKA